MKVNEAVGVIEKNASSLNAENIETLFAVLEDRAKSMDDFVAPWTPQAKRSDLKIVAWLKDHKKPATYSEIAEGLGKTLGGVTEDAVKLVVDNDQENKEDYRKFKVDGDMVSLVIKKARKATVIFTKK